MTAVAATNEKSTCISTIPKGFGFARLRIGVFFSPQRANGYGTAVFGAVFSM